MSEFHDLAEVALNEEDASWGNLGYWADHRDYSGACRALAMLLGDALRLDKNSVAMDLGFGCGDQLLLWREHYGIAGLSGVNFSQSQTEMAHEKLCAAGFPEDTEKLLAGDATDSAHWNRICSKTKPNCVVALDCAYHFSNRKKLFALAAENLQAGGRIGLTDLFLSDNQQSFTDRWILEAMLKLSRIPALNMVTRTQYADQLQRAGFERVEVRDISEDVTIGFARWWREYRRSPAGQKLPLRSRLKYAVTARFLTWAYRKNILRYCIVTANVLDDCV